eukprot:182510-Pelagomonas_calceolata.AAC.1
MLMNKSSVQCKPLAGKGGVVAPRHAIVAKSNAASNANLETAAKAAVKQGELLFTCLRAGG